MSARRIPYVGEGADGCRRSARIDREEAEGLAHDDSRRDTLEMSAQAWERQADEMALAAARATPRLTWAVLANGDRLCRERPVLLRKPIIRGGGAGWMIRVPTVPTDDALDQGDGFWWRPMWDHTGEDLTFGNLAETIAFVEESLLNTNPEDDSSFADLLTFVQDAENDTGDWTAERRDAIAKKTQEQHEAFQALRGPRPAAAPRKTSRADLLVLLDETYDLLSSLYAPGPKAVALFDQQVDALLERIRKINR